MQDDFILNHFDGCQGKLADVANFVFHVHLQIVRREERFCFLKYLHEFARCQPVVNVISKPRLQSAQGVISQYAATIHESFVNACHFGDMRMRWYGISVRQNETNICRRVFC